MITFLQGHELGLNYKTPIIGVSGLKGTRQFDSFMEFCKEYQIRVHHWWPYYTDDNIDEVTFRFDVDSLSEEIQVLIKLSFS